MLYFLDSGSAIGALRHGGIIPWDDDLDIIIRAEDEAMFQGKIRMELLEKQIKMRKGRPDGIWDYKLEFSSEIRGSCDVFVIEHDKSGNTYIFKNPRARRVWHAEFKESVINPILTKFGSFQMRILPNGSYHHFNHVYGKHWKIVAKTPPWDHYTDQDLKPMSFLIPESITT